MNTIQSKSLNFCFDTHSILKIGSVCGVWSSGSNVCASPEKEKQGPFSLLRSILIFLLAFFFSFCTQAECVSQTERNSGNSVNLTVRFKYKNYSCTPLQRAESSGSCAQLYIKKVNEKHIVFNVINTQKHTGKYFYVKLLYGHIVKKLCSRISILVIIFRLSLKFIYN